MTDDLITICERWERKGFETGFHWGIGVTVGFAALVGLAMWWWK